MGSLSVITKLPSKLLDIKMISKDRIPFSLALSFVTIPDIGGWYGLET